MSINFRLQPLELQSGIDAMVGRATDSDRSNSYDPLAMQSVTALDRGIDNARDVVTTQMLVDGTLAVMRQPTVWERLPLEISDRTIVAVDCAERLGRTAAEGMLFASLFRHSRDLGPLMTDEDLQATQDTEYMEKLGSLAFSDASLAIGGAHRVLKRLELTEPIADIISRSTALPGEVSKVDKVNARRAALHLGFPYILPRYLSVVNGRDGLPDEVILNDDARRYIRTVSNSDGGCPAALIPNPHGRGTVLTNAWEEMVSVLVPEGATSNLRNTRKSNS